MAVPGMFRGMFNSAKASVMSSKVMKNLTSEDFGADFMQRCFSHVQTNYRSYGGRAMRHGINMGGADYLNNAGHNIWGSNALKAAAINAGVGGVYGGLTDSYNPAGGAIRGAALGAGLGLAGRGGIYGAAQMRMRGNNARYNGAYDKAIGLYGKAITKAYSM
jgi:hypothetical protein